MEYTTFTGQIERIGYWAQGEMYGGLAITLEGYSTIFVVSRPENLPFGGLSKPGDTVSFSEINLDRYVGQIHAASFQNLTYPRASLKNK
jgi:hypothetical protein